MKIKLYELNPNPFKKEINGGKLNKEQIESIKANIKELGLMGAIPVFKKDNKFFLVNGHHRVQALKEVYGKDFEVNVIVHDYNEDQVMRGMVIENLTQRSGEYKEMKENVVVVRKYLGEHKEILVNLRESRQLKNAPRLKGGEFKDKPTSKDIVKWIDPSEKVIEHDEVTNLLNINDNLAPELEKTVVKKHDKTKEEREDESLNYSQAIILSRIESHKEQEELAVALKESQEQRVREQGKLITQYKEATEETKQKVRSGEMDLVEVPIENLKENIKKKIEEDKEKNKGKLIITHFKQYEKETGNRIGRTNREIVQTCAYLLGLDNTGVLYNLDWKTMLKLVEIGTSSSRNYNKFMEKILTKIK